MNIKKWTTDGLLDEIIKIDSIMVNRSFMFILGSGASLSSNIPTGKELAKKLDEDPMESRLPGMVRITFRVENVSRRHKKAYSIQHSAITRSIELLSDR
jgi:hypothetical protein